MSPVTVITASTERTGLISPTMRLLYSIPSSRYVPRVMHSLQRAAILGHADKRFDLTTTSYSLYSYYCRWLVGKPKKRSVRSMVFNEVVDDYKNLHYIAKIYFHLYLLQKFIVLENICILFVFYLNILYNSYYINS